MSVLEYLIWFIATAVMIIAILSVGTLAAAGILAREATSRADDDADDRVEQR